MKIQQLVNTAEIAMLAGKMVAGDSVALSRAEGTWLVYEIRKRGYKAVRHAEGKDKYRVWMLGMAANSRASRKEAVKAALNARRIERRGVLDDWDKMVQKAAYRVAKAKSIGNRMGLFCRIDEICAVLPEHRDGVECQRNRVGRSMRRLPGWQRIQVGLPDGARPWMYFSRSVAQST